MPDGDTGTNLTLTVRAIDEALSKDGPDDRVGLAKEISRAALMGARGNSGVILSQIVRGATESLAETDDLARAFRSASDAAYRAVKKPVEGTMLTAIRSMADAAEHGADLDGIIARGDDTVAQTREMLPVLKEAGVVDAGAAGLVEIIRGIHAAITGEVLAPPPEVEPEFGFEAIHQELSRYRYCTVFVVEGDGLDADELEAELEQLGDSLLVVGDSTALKVHVHTDDPGRALSLGIARGAIGGVEIANMHVQTQQREERLLHSVPDDHEACAVVAVSLGAGNRVLFESFGARRRRRRTHDEPVDVGSRRGDRARAGPGGDRAAQQRQCDPHRRARGGERNQDRARDPHAVAAGGLCGARRVRPVARRGGEPGRDASCGRTGSRPVRSRSPRATCS